MPTKRQQPDGEFVSLRAAALMVGVPPGRVQKEALLKKVRTLALPGEALKYSAEDCRKLFGTAATAK